MPLLFVPAEDDDEADAVDGDEPSSDEEAAAVVEGEEAKEAVAVAFF